MNRRRACLVALFTLGLTSVAQAAELYTAPLFAELTEYVSCEIVNVSAKTRTVRIRVIDSFGNVLGDSGDRELVAGRVESRAVLGQSLFGSAYCRFTVEGGKNLYRAAAKIGSSVTSDFAAVPAY
jgi:hypothetical protein